MKRTTGLFLPVFLCMLLLQACSKPKALEYREIKGLRLQNASLQQATIVLDLQFYNPNNYGLRLKNGDVDAFLNGKFVGKARLDEGVAVPARDTFTMPVTITATLAGLVGNAINLLTKQEQLIPVRLEGAIRAGKGGVFVPVKVRYEGMQRIRL